MSYKELTDSTRTAIMREAEQRFGFNSYNNDGWSQGKPFLNPHNPADTNASCRINFFTGIINDFGGSTHSPHETAKLWGIELEYEGDNGHVTPAPALSKAPETMEEFAFNRGTTAQAYRDVGWVMGIQMNRPGFEFPTKNGKRMRFIDRYEMSQDKKLRRFNHPAGYKPCWYGLDRAIKMDMGFIVLVNGESSTVAAQDNGIPACCTTSSGERKLSDDLLKELQDAYDKQIYIALDCDSKGREAAAKLHAQLPGSIVIDLNMPDMDMGDFCRLHQPKPEVLPAWRKLIASHRVIEPPKIHKQSDLIVDWIDYMNGGMKLVDLTPDTIAFPIKSMHQYKGACHWLRARSMVAVVANSGGGKTSFLRMLVDEFRVKQKVNIAYWGTEFSPLDYLEMFIQSAYGIPQTLFEQDRKARKEERDGIPARLCRGILIADYVERVTRNGANPHVKEWPLKIKNALATLDVGRETWGEFSVMDFSIGLPVMLDMLEDHMALQSSKGKPITVLIIDYLQRVQKSKTEGEHPDEHNLALIDEFTNRHNLVTFIGNQTTKQETRDNMRTGRMGSTESMKFATSNKFKMVLNLRVGWKENEYFQLVRDEDDDAIGVSKNNRGMVHIQHPMTFDGPRLTWRERRDSSQLSTSASNIPIDKRKDIEL